MEHSFDVGRAKPDRERGLVVIQHLFKPSRRRNGKRVVSRIWWAQYRLDGEDRITRVSLGTGDKRVAEQRLRVLVEAREYERAGVGVPGALRDASDQTILEHLERWIADLDARGRSAEYVRHVRSRVETLCRECDWNRLADVTAASFIAWRSSRTNSPKTLNDYLDAMRCLLEWLRRAAQLLENPLALVDKAETRGRQSMVRRAFKDAEMRRLLEVAGPRRTLYIAAVHTGLRWGELRALTWADIELGAYRPFIRARAATTKNRRDAVIWLAAELADQLRAFRPGDADPSNRVFSTMPSHHTYARDLKRAGIDRVDSSGRRVDFHAFRHTFATNLHRGGVSQRVAMELMRHSDPRLTAKTYTDASALPTADAVDRLPTFLCDAQIDAQGMFAGGHEAARRGTDEESSGRDEVPTKEEVRRNAAQPDTMRRNGQKNGAGGIRTPVPEQSADRLYACSRSFNLDFIPRERQHGMSSRQTEVSSRRGLSAH